MTDTTPTLAAFVKPQVDLAMAHQFRLELVHPHLQQRMTPAQREEFLTRAFVEVADARGQGQMTNKPELLAAARALEAKLAAASGPHHTAQSPLFKVLIGADRLYVKSGYPLKDLPAQFMGFPVEASAIA